MKEEDIKIGDYVWFRTDNPGHRYARDYFGGLMGPYQVAYEHGSAMVGIKKPNGRYQVSREWSRTFRWYLRKDVFLTAVKDALKHA